MKTRKAILLLVTLVLLMPAALVFAEAPRAITAPPGEGVAQIQQQIDEIQKNVEQLRGLKAKSPITFDFLNRDQLRDKLIQDFDKDWPPDERATTQELMVMLGFLEPGQDLYQLELDLLTEQIAGFYDPEDKKLYLISDQQELTGMDKVAMAHEICHALQDQYFSLDQPPYDVEDSHQDDEVSAATALVEGDAQRITEEYAANYLTLADMLSGDSGGSTTHFDAAPQYIQDSLLFPYIEGLSFVNSKVRDSNAKADALFANPPDSTEQIMHPGDYPDDQPWEVDIPDLSDALGGGWSEIEYNVLGEFDVMELFDPYMSTSKAEKAAEGWGGNLYEYYRQESGDGRLLVMSFEWDTSRDAQEFVDAFDVYVPERFPGADESESDGWTRWHTADYAFALKVEGRRTDVIQSTEPATVSAVMEAVGTADVPQAAEWNWWVVGVVGGLGLLAIAMIVAIVMISRHYNRPHPPGAGPDTPVSF